MTVTHTDPTKLTRDDFKSDQDVRWCPGCGDYAILAQVQRVFPELGIPRENFAIISGIGCSSRFPYYMDTYGFHTIHGRAPAIATGLKLARPELSVWIATGDGDGLSIGGNHFIHVLRRNVDVNILLFNNEIYGLTKGQYSPTSEFGKRTKSTPFGSVDYPFKPISVALGVEASFVARTIDREPAHLGNVLRQAAKHKGASFVEIYQNCNIFNDGAFAHLTDKKTKADTVMQVEHGKPLLFGANDEMGIVFDGFDPKVVRVSDVGIDQIAVHDERGPLGYHAALARMFHPDFPTPIGVFRAVERPSYDDLVTAQMKTAADRQGPGDLMKLIHGSNTWRVDPQ
jgi:2-oxoglutarate ferredoxin oxidoreductase subunit beta